MNEGGLVGVNFYVFLSSFITFFTALIKCTLQETLSCGATSFQVTFEPSRPMFSNTLVAAAAAAAAAASSGNGNNGNVGSLSGSTSGISVSPTAKYSYRPLERLLSDAQVCNLTLSNRLDNLGFLLSGGNNVQPLPSFSTTNSNFLNNLPESRMIITKCDNCSRCPQELPTIHRLLSKMAVEADLQSLLVIVHGSSDIGSNGFINSENVEMKDTEYIKLADNTITKFVFMDEEPGQLTLCELMADSVDNDALKNFSKTSVLFVSISFIILMVISLAWLVFYYVQRFRYAHAKDRLQRRLFNAAKKALGRIPTRPVKAGDKDLDMDCPVCIDPYKTGDIVRMLPCRHTFHKCCVDPWLLEHRTCPMCKSDILKAFGYQITISTGSSGSSSSNGRRRTQFSGSQIDSGTSELGHHRTDSYGYCRNHYHRGNASHNLNNGASNFDCDNHRNTEPRLSIDDANSTTSESNAFTFPVVNEVHDPFGFMQANPPQLVQVIHATNAKGFSIIPFTVHNSTAVVDTHCSNEEENNKNVKNYTQFYSIPKDNRTATISMVNGEKSSTNRITPRKVYSSDGNYHDTSNENGIFRVKTSGSRRPTRGHVVNLVHLRSRSLNHAQLTNSMNSIVSRNDLSNAKKALKDTENELQANNLIHSNTALISRLSDNRPSVLLRSVMVENGENSGKSLMSKQYSNNSAPISPIMDELYGLSFSPSSRRVSDTIDHAIISNNHKNEPHIIAMPITGIETVDHDIGNTPFSVSQQ